MPDEGVAGKSQESDIGLTWVGILSCVNLGNLFNLFESPCHHVKNKDTIISPGKLLPCCHQAPALAALYQGPGFAGTFS